MIVILSKPNTVAVKLICQKIYFYWLTDRYTRNFSPSSSPSLTSTHLPFSLVFDVGKRIRKVKEKLQFEVKRTRWNGKSVVNNSYHWCQIMLYVCSYLVCVCRLLLLLRTFNDTQNDWYVSWWTQIESFVNFWMLSDACARIKKKMKRKFVGILNSPRKLTMDAMMTAFASMIATAKINISAPCVKASRLELYCCRTLSVCRCIVAPDSRSNHAKSCRQNIVHGKIHNISLVVCECVYSTVLWSIHRRDSMSFLFRFTETVNYARRACLYVSLSRLFYLSSPHNQSWRTTAIDDESI